MNFRKFYQKFRRPLAEKFQRNTKSLAILQQITSSIIGMPS